MFPQLLLIIPVALILASAIIAGALGADQETIGLVTAAAAWAIVLIAGWWHRDSPIK
ncbi:hypothetical protein [Bradyrhizobium genosp. A]|uniref:hypothetical protein n=1 Tax=Bradyrhizobium genosp. A TaxID=83626 RepID=UPI003CED8676